MRILTCSKRADSKFQFHENKKLGFGSKGDLKTGYNVEAEQPIKKIIKGRASVYFYTPTAGPQKYGPATRNPSEVY